MLVKAVTDRLAYFVVRAFFCFLQCLRLETCQWLAHYAAILCADVFKLRHEIVEENLRQAMPELTAAERRDLERRMWEHLFLLVVEVAQAPQRIHIGNWRRYVRIPEADRVTRLLLDERPLIIVSAHFGNFELAGFVFGLFGFPTYSVARPLDNPHLDAFLARFRGATGQHLIPKKGGLPQIVEVLSHGGTLAFLADQYAGSKGCWVEFFGRPASAHKAIALFALEHQAPVFVGYARRTGKPFEYEFGVAGIADPASGGPEVANVKALTQWYTSRLEEAIRLAPEQYWWLHRRWKDNRAARKKDRAGGRQQVA